MTQQRGEERGDELVKVRFTNGDDAYVKVHDITYALQHIHSSIGHGMGHLVYNSAKRWFTCRGLLRMCHNACASCVCKLVKPNVGRASKLGKLDTPPCANYNIHMDTYDTEVPSRWMGKPVRYIQVRIDPYNNRIGASILYDKTAKESWNVFVRDHVNVLGKPCVVHIDTGPEYKGEFPIKLRQAGIRQTLRAVARGQSNAKAERVQGELGPALFAEIKERGMEYDEWPKVLQTVVDKLNRRPTMSGKPSPYEKVNGTPPFFSAVAFLHAFSDKHKVRLPVHQYKIGERVFFYNPNRKRVKWAERFEEMIVDKLLSPHTVLLRACDGNKIRSETYRVVAHVTQLTRKIDVQDNMISAPPKQDKQTNDKKPAIDVKQFAVGKMAIWRDYLDKQLKIGRIKEKNDKSLTLVINPYGSHSVSATQCYSERAMVTR